MGTQEHDFSLSDLFTPLTSKKAVLIIFCIGFLVFFNMLFNGFVWDDLTYIIGNKELEGFRLTSLVGQNMFNSSGYFRPVPAVYFSLLYNLFGQTSFFYHFFQLLLHLLSSSLLFFLYRKFFAIRAALILSLIFLVHPINVESVAYIGSTQSQLYFLFGGAALYLSFIPRLDFKKILLIHFLLGLALFTKEVAILYFLLIYLYRFLNKLPIPRIFPISTFALILFYLAVRVSVLDTFLHRMELIPISEISTLERLLHIPAVFMYYPKTFFFPVTLAINQIWTITTFNFRTFFFPLLSGLVFFAGLIWVLLRRFWYNTGIRHNYIFFLAWFLLGMGFLLQIFPLDMTVADRWFYFPMVGLLGILGLVFTQLPVFAAKSGKTSGLWVVIILISLLSARTIVRNADWYDALTLYTRDAGKYENYDLENNLGAELAFSGDFSAALPHFLESVRLLPHDTNLFNAGTSYERLQDYPKAIRFYRQALEIRTGFPKHDQVAKLATEGLGKMLLLHDRPEAANIFLRDSVEKYPENGSLWAFLAINEYGLKHYEAAETAAAKAKTLLPNPTTEKLFSLIFARKPVDLRLE